MPLASTHCPGIHRSIGQIAHALQNYSSYDEMCVLTALYTHTFSKHVSIQFCRWTWHGSVRHAVAGTSRVQALSANRLRPTCALDSSTAFMWLRAYDGPEPLNSPELAAYQLQMCAAETRLQCYTRHPLPLVKGWAARAS